jgi:hypothetical protein
MGKLDQIKIDSMKFTQVRVLLFTFSLAGMLVLTGGCKGGSQDGDRTKDSIDTPQVVKVEPQDFPVNDLPDSIFGKVATKAMERSLKIGQANLTPAAGVLPDWLDQILSRESIVLFAKGILTALPDEVEFVQTGNALYDGPDGWKAFTVNFTTRPTDASMVVYGAYLNEEKSYWASQSDKGKLAMTLKVIKPTDKGVELWGEWTQGAKPVPFHATLTKETTTLAQ